jgi:hypothetical protein
MKASYVLSVILAFLDIITVPAIKKSMHSRYDLSYSNIVYESWILLTIILLFNLAFAVWCIRKLMELDKMAIKLNYQQEFHSCTQNEVEKLMQSKEYADFLLKYGSNEIEHNWQLKERTSTQRQLDDRISTSPWKAMPATTN